ncbi:MAG: right-handed parallel beta-helix repeat-containing protein [Pseudomonadota bacterium]|nr:right-handed parallel beta-helix repeat-containing protein [Pseudomonadota bacterium]
MRLNRRRFVGGLLGTTAVGGMLAKPLRAISSLQLDSRPPTDVVEAFGFVGDGRTDNYRAFHRWVAHANRAGGGHYVFPAGTYYVERYRSLPMPQSERQNAQPAPIVGCDGLTITGYGAKIVLNGNFHRRAGQEVLDVTFLPFEFKRCRNVRIAGFEMDGGVRGMTRDPAANEVYAHLISLLGCSNVTLQDLDLHHSQTDAVYLYEEGFNVAGRAGIACRNVTMQNVHCHNNARGGLAAFHVLGLLCTDCSFNENGHGLGRYRSHAPGYGVDVEPDHFEPHAIDTRTGDLEFRRCTFNDNVSAFLAAYLPRYQGYLRIVDCSSSSRFGYQHHMIIAWRGALVQGGVHDAGNASIWTCWQVDRGGDFTIRDCEIRSSALYGVHHAFPGNRLTLERVKITGTHRRAAGHGFVLAIHGDPGGGQRNSLQDCEIFVPAARHLRADSYDYEVSLHHTHSESNLFATNLPAIGGRHFAVEYGPGTVVRGDRFRGTAPGPADSFRPAHNAAHDTRARFSRP